MKYSQSSKLSPWVFSFLLAISTVSAQSVAIGEACRFSLISEGKIVFDPAGTKVNGDVDAIFNKVEGISELSENSDVFYTGISNSPGAPALRDIQLALTSSFESSTSIAAHLGGDALVPGVYEIHEDARLGSFETLTLTADNTNDFIFLIRGDLTLGLDSSVQFQGLASGNNVYWIVSGIVTLASKSPFYGTIMSPNSINFLDNSKLIGRAYSKSLIRFGASASVSLPENTACPCSTESAALGFCENGSGDSASHANSAEYEAALAVATTNLPSAVISQGNAGPILLGSHALSFTMLAMTGISTIPNSNIIGDIGVSPIANTAMTGFAFGDKLSSSQISSGNRAWGPSDSGSLTDGGIAEVHNAYLSGSTQFNPDVAELEGGQLDGLTLYPGLYSWGTTVRLAAGANVTLNGNCGDIFVLQVADTMVTGANSKVILTGGVTAATVYWILATSLTTGANSEFAGTTLALTTVVLGTNTNYLGRIYSQTAITLDRATVAHSSIGSGPVVVSGVCELEVAKSASTSSHRMNSRRRLH